MALAQAESLTLGSTYRFKSKTPIRKDGDVWDLAGASVELRFKRPDLSTLVVPITGILPDGNVYYDGTIGTLNQLGQWTRSWRVLQGSIDIKSLPVRFLVEPAP